MKKLSRAQIKWKTAITFFIGIYLLSYACLSLLGGWRLQETGQSCVGMMLMPDEIVWKPACCWFQPEFDTGSGTTTRGDLLGFLYAPLIFLDQRFVHRSRSIPGSPVATTPQLHDEVSRVFAILESQISTATTSDNLTDDEIRVLLPAKPDPKSADQ